MKSAPFLKALNYAERLLAVKDRSRREIEQRLEDKSYNKDCIAEVVEYLKQKGFVDDKRLVSEWLKASSTWRPKGVLAIKSELYKRGINEELINDALKDADIGYDEYKIAKAIVEKRSKELKGVNDFKRKKNLYSYLARRGFSFDVINDIIE
ncbi:MAG: regulatory protein RecX [Candidatus Omnitrophota bacterium]